MIKNNQISLPMSKSYTEVKMVKFSHLWTIKNFNVIPSDQERVCSPYFSPPSSKDTWFLKLRPNATEEGSGMEYIGIHLFLKSTEDKNKTQVRARYTISVLDADGKKRFTGECSKSEGRIFKAGTEGHGYKFLAPRDMLINPGSTILGSDMSLKVLVEIHIFGDMVTIQTQVENEDLYTEDELNDSNIATNLKAFLLQEKSTDLTLVSMEGKEIKVHKAILMARSSVFSAMFDHETREKQENRVLIEDLSFKILSDLVRFMYSDEVPDIDNVAEDLIQAADKYDVKRLKVLCEVKLAETLNIENAAQMITLADMANACRLKNKAMEFVAANPEKVAATEGWNKDVRKRPLLYKEAFDILAKKRKTL